MKSTPLIINWHETNAPIYSAHFEPQGKGRLATGGGDRSVRLWKIECDGENRKAEYLSTLAKHTQAVNVVRWAPKGELLASAGDDGNVILWVQSETAIAQQFGAENNDDKETWRAKHMCRSSGAEIYDLAWSPDSAYFIIGSMDNIARIYSAATGTIVRQVADHSHYVQGVAWDPLNEYIATQSSDRSVHIYALRTKDGQYTLANHDAPSRIASHSKTDMPPRRISSNSPAPPEFGFRSSSSSSQLMVEGAVTGTSASLGSPVPSAPGTPTSMALPMNPPSVMSHSRRSSLSSRRSPSPVPSMPLPAVMPMEASPKPHTMLQSVASKNASLYLNETLTSFFRRLTFTPDGSLLLTPSGQYQSQYTSDRESKPTFEVTNTVYIYTRGGINKPPIAYLPGHKKPSIAVKCSPIIYTLRGSPPKTKHITMDTSSAEDPIPSLPEPLSKPSPMEPPPPPTPVVSSDANSTPSKLTPEASGVSSQGPTSTFALNYRVIYAVATQDSVLLYDTQQKTPFCVVSNLHCATFTDLTWSSDGLTLLISSSDGFCSTLSFAAGELGQACTGESSVPKAPPATGSNQSTPAPTPTAAFAQPTPPQPAQRATVFAAPSPSNRPASPARSNSASSISSPVPSGVLSNPPQPALISGGTVPSLTAANSGKVVGVPVTTPPETPRSNAGTATNTGSKRDANESERKEEGQEKKKRRITPTVVEPKP